MKRNPFHETPAPLIPIDRVAARVLIKTETYHPDKKIRNVDRPYPLETRKPTRSEINAPGFIDLSGHRFGRFIVVGISVDAKASWVVRCQCGRYSLRKSKAIKNPENTQDRCEHCRHLAFLKREEKWRRTGIDQDVRDF